MKSVQEDVNRFSEPADPKGLWKARMRRIGNGDAHLKAGLVGHRNRFR